MIRIDTLWLCSQPQDMRAGADRLLSVVVNTVGQARAHHGEDRVNLVEVLHEARRDVGPRGADEQRAVGCS